MMRIGSLLIVCLCLAAPLVTVPASAAVCAPGCPDDGPDGRCDPACDCVACGCHALRLLVPSESVTIDAPALAAGRCADDDGSLPPVDPVEILHVPKSSLA